MKSQLLAATILVLAVNSLFSADWPQWRGPKRDGHSADTGLLDKWPAGGPKLLWTYAEAGIGYSGPAVVGNVLYSMGGEKGKDEFVFALDVTTGKQIWRTGYGECFNNQYGGGPRGTPCVDGDSVYALGAKGDLVCLDAKSGSQRWKKNVIKEFGGKMMSGWGYSESVLVDGDQVVCCPGGQSGTFAAFDKKTGDLKWQSDGLTDDVGYSSIVVSEAGGVRQYVTLTGKSLAGVAAKDGKLLWQIPGEGFRIAVIPTPIVADDHIFATTDYGAKNIYAKLTKDGAGVKAEKVYSNKTLENHHGGVILIDGHVYGSHQNANNKDSLPFVCLNLQTGSAAWSENRKLEPSGLTYADGHLYCYGQQTGALVKVKPSKAGYSEIARFTIPQESKQRSPSGAIWTHPVIANGKLYLRDQELLYCFDLKN